MKKSWRITYPTGIISFLEAFRNKFLDYEEICRILDKFFKEQKVRIRNICELGSGTGTNLISLAQKGYNCLGLDSNYESIKIAHQRAHESGIDITFKHMDFFEKIPSKLQDAMLVLFVPLSIADMSKLAIRMAHRIRQGGYFICIMLGMATEVKHRRIAQYQDIEYVTIEKGIVIRFNFYSKLDRQVEWDAIYLIENEDRFRVAHDHDTFDLIMDDQILQLPKNLYHHMKRLNLTSCKSCQCPPMTYEVMDFYQRV